jgi:hypothetical protein
MESEDILASFSASYWWVQAKYLFENPTSEEIELQMGFPESRCPGDTDCHVQPPFTDMHTLVRGKAVHQERGSVWLGAKFPELGRVWTYRVRFAPHERVEILHNYKISSSYTVGGDQSLLYITVTGALWATPIGRARFRFWMPPDIKSYRQNDESPKHHPVLVPRSGALVAEVVFDFTDWRPDYNLEVSFNQSRDAFGPDTGTRAGTAGILPRCPLGGGPIGGEDKVLNAAEAGDAELEALAAEWSKYGVEALLACRVYLLARYGRRFHDDRLNHFFYGSEGFTPKPPPYLAFEPNPEFCESMMEPEDRLLLKAINRAMARAREHSTSAPGKTAPN